AGWSQGGTWTIAWTNPADASGVKKVHYRKDGGDWNTSTAASLILSASDINNLEGTHEVEFYLEDAVGNFDATSLGTAEIMYDKTKPVARIVSWTKVDPQDPTTYRLNISVTDPLPGSGVTKVRLRNNDSNWLNNSDGWSGYTSDIYDFTIDDGADYDIYAQFQDGAGNISNAVFVTVNPGAMQPPPAVAAIDPSGMVAGGNPDVTITGSNFRAGETVKLIGTGDLAVNAVSYQLVVRQTSPSQIIAKVPSGVTSGLYRVVVTNDDGQGSVDDLIFNAIWDPNASPVSLALTATGPTTLYDGQSAAFAAKGQFSDGSVRDVTSSAVLSLAPGTPGTVSANTYTAPGQIAANGTVTVTASYKGQSASADLTLVAKVLDSLSLDLDGVPVSNVTGIQGFTKQFTVIANYNDQRTAEVTNANWTVSPADLGTMQNGKFSATGIGTGTLTAAFSGKTAAVTVSVAQDPATILDSLSLYLDGAPAGNVTGIQGFTKQFTVIARYHDQRTVEVTTANWTVSPANLGTMDPAQNGKFSATGIGTGTLTAAFGDKTAAVAVSVAQDPLSYVKISTGSVKAGSPLVFTVTGFQGDGTPLALGDRQIYWNNSTQSGGTTYTVTAPEQPADISVTVSVPPAVPVSLTVRVEPGDLATLTVSGPDTVQAGGTAQFSAAGADKFNNAVENIPLVWRASQGNISTGGLLTGLTSVGTVTVTAQAGSVTAQKAITVSPRYSAVTVQVENDRVVIAGKDPAGNSAPLTDYTVTYSVTGQEHGNKILDNGTFVEGDTEGSFTVTATVNADGRSYTATSTVNVNKGAPRMTVKIDNQALNNNLIISSQPQFNINLTDGNGVKAVRVFIDGTQMTSASLALRAQDVQGTAATASFTTDTELAAGEHSLVIESEDNLGVKGSVTASGLKVYDSLEIIGQPMNYPNPFKPGTQSTTINYKLTKSVDIKLMISDLSGRLVYNQLFAAGTPGGSAGENEPTWNGKDFNGVVVPNGVYIYLLTSGGKALGRGELSVYE
ncbi:MAG TPA: IPT/TIG domain-containing protein, partial [Candidatus Sulfotelmatobacter sp.]|nr:IPT/TIG domain-containing protein [Candidatus Sulfotelmatobacter sp.]